MKKVIVDLVGIPSEHGLKPLRFESRSEGWPFAILRYSINGETQEHGIRFDFGKKDKSDLTLTLDNFQEPNFENAVNSMRQKLEEFLPSVRRHLWK